VVKVFTPPPRKGDCELIPVNEDPLKASDALADRILSEKIL
jgi:hypothetical protein